MHRDWIQMMCSAIKSGDMNLKINIAKIFLHYSHYCVEDPAKWGNDRIYKEVSQILKDGICNFRNGELLQASLETILKLTDMELTRDIILTENFANRLINLLTNKVNSVVDSIIIKC